MKYNFSFTQRSLRVCLAAILSLMMVVSSFAQSSKQTPRTQLDVTMSFAPLVKQTSSAVVNVYAERMVRATSPFAGDPFFEQFFGRQSPNRSNKQSALGSGVIIDKTGIVITNHHVIADADDIRIALSDGREFKSRLLLKDESVDLAVLQIEGDQTFDAIEFGDSDAMEVGDLVLAIGNPFGVGQTVTSGIVSALARNQVGVSDFGSFIQTDAAINPGNSGGALIDMNGRLIGINTAIFTRSGGSNGIGVAIPAHMVRAVAASAIGGNDKFVRPFMGATFEPVTSDIADALGIDRARGALISSIMPDGPADRAGLRAGDLVFAFNGQAVEHPDALGYRLATANIGAVIELGVHSRGKNRGVKVRLEAPPKGTLASTVTLVGSNPFAGAKVVELTPFLADQLKLPVNRKGIVVIDIEQGSSAARYGFLPSDLIVSVLGRELKSVAQFEEILSAGARFWRLEIIRDGRRIRQILR
jgi:Do/DeqQ family serine protease